MELFWPLWKKLQDKFQKTVLFCPSLTLLNNLPAVVKNIRGEMCLFNFIFSNVNLWASELIFILSTSAK